MLAIFNRAPKPKLLDEESFSINDEYSDRVEHNRLANKLLVGRTVATTKSCLSKLLKEQGIGVYDQAKVEKWMDKKGYWYWYALRKQDAMAHRASVVRITPHLFPRIYGGMKQHVIYDKLVPLPVLYTVDNLCEAMIQAQNEPLLFFVAALEENPDPFLGVMSAQEPDKFYIIERWDEPGFRG